MSYHITILRVPSAPIQLEEVMRALVHMPGRLALSQDAQPDPLVYEPAKGDQSEIMALTDGELWAKNPSEEFLRLMIELAGLLGARARGDEFETYRSIDETYWHPDDRELIEEAAQLSREMASRQRRTDWISRIAPMLVALLIGCIYARYK